MWRRLDAAGLAAAVSMLVHEPRRDEGGLPADAGRRRLARPTPDGPDLERAWRTREQAHGLPVSASRTLGMAWTLHRWAAASASTRSCGTAEMAAGDFVRRCKQIVDLLGQIGDAAPRAGPGGTARKAVDAVLRGVVAIWWADRHCD